MTDAPERIWAETEPYDFRGYSPCWVYHSADELPLEEASGCVEYVRADIHAALEAKVEKLRAALETMASSEPCTLGCGFPRFARAALEDTK